MKALIALLIVLVAILHQDFWWWDDPTPVFGFLPVGLGWHIVLSIAAGVLWWLATRFAWPEGLDEQPAPEQPATGEERGR